MRVVITKNAEQSLLESYLYIYERSPRSADKIYDLVMKFIFDNLSEFPKLGHIYNELQNVYRLVHSKTGHNIYYIIKEDTVYILYIIDGKVNLNQEISLSGIPFSDFK